MPWSLRRMSLGPTSARLIIRRRNWRRTLSPAPASFMAKALVPTSVLSASSVVSRTNFSSWCAGRRRPAGLLLPLLKRLTHVEAIAPRALVDADGAQRAVRFIEDQARQQGPGIELF